MAPRIGFLGAGLIAHLHAFGLHTTSEPCTFAGVHDPDPSRAAEFATGWGATVCETEDALLGSCDAVYVCTWTSEHARLVDAACERGLPVFCEKPLAFDGPRAAAMADAVDAAGVVNQVGLVLRHSPAFAYLRHLVRDPAAGRVMSVVFRDDQYIPVQGMYASTWRGDRDRAGAGTLLEHSIHDVDILEWILGPIASVSARAANFHGLDGIEDSVGTVFDLVGGGLGVHTTVWHDVVERPSLRRVEVLCERRHVVLENDWDGPLTWTATGEPERTLAGPDLVAACADAGLTVGDPDGAFVRAVTTGRPAWPTLRDAVRPHEVVDAIYRSAGEGGTRQEVPDR
jgi:predicted dehydrogenase